MQVCGIETGVTRNLVLVLGDQLDEKSAAFDGFDPQQDRVLMIEAAEEATHVWSHKTRIVMFLSAMRHFAESLRKRKWSVDYQEQQKSLAAGLKAALKEHKPQQVVMVEPGDFRVVESLKAACSVKLDVREDRHFISSIADFKRHAAGKKRLLLEFFYRELRKKTGVLMDGAKPTGGDWNFDSENRKSFGKEGPGKPPSPKHFAPDSITKEVIALVEKRYAKHPGLTDNFDFPVTAKQSQEALSDFIENRLEKFGDFQDAMWDGPEAYLYHSRLSAAMNLKLLDPREAIAAAEKAYREGRAPLAAVEGFVRQILGWREYVRGIYWAMMPEYGERNFLQAETPLPNFFWTGETDMNCLRHTIRQTLEYGYAHHIQRLMVTGLYSLMLGVRPKEIHEWYLAIYIDAIDWVELPNVIGMSQFADGGTMATKPYVATGKYIQRMSNYCSGCRYDPAESIGENACPITTLYWEFLLRHEETLKKIPRMEMQLRNLTRLAEAKKAAIKKKAADHRESLIQISNAGK
jgi:deoxyribodipyrimidine photolyase-related protein